MNRIKTYLATTGVPASKSCAEIMDVLLDCGAINPGFLNGEGGRRRVGVRFSLKIGGEVYPFQMCPNTDAVFRLLQADRSDRGNYRKEAREKDREQSERIAWRQVLYLVRAQVAVAALELANPGQVFMGFLTDRDGVSAFDKFVEQAGRALGPGEEEG